MDKYTKEIMELIKKAFEEVSDKRAYQRGSEARFYWLDHYEDNLIHPMGVKALKAYEEGSGKEISSGKIGALKSSSAMTYNLFGNQAAEILCTDNRLGTGVYEVEFEKQLHTLRGSSRPAHLDAFLYCEHTKEAIACEMKMTEWLFNDPGTLRAAYLDPQRYFDTTFGEVMVPLARELAEYESLWTERDEYPCRMERYDAFQMFKHVSACYTACLNKDPGEIQKLTLVNCIWTLPDPSLLSAESSQKYCETFEAELSGFDQFQRTMDIIKDEFAKIGVDFEICAYTFADFLTLFHKTPEELNYLRRYTLI